MALIRCKLCDNKISSRAMTCPKCGCPNIARTDERPKHVKNCSECEKGGVDGGYACNLCDVDTPSRNSSANRVTPEVQQQAGYEHRIDVAVIAKIEELDVDDHLKNLFMKIAIAKVVNSRFGLPVFDYGDDPLKYYAGFNSAGALGSNMALILGPFYYFSAGIWRKGVL